MPSTSKAQHNMMAAVAHGWKPKGGWKGGHGPSKAVAKEFMSEDKKSKGWKKKAKA